MERSALRSFATGFPRPIAPVATGGAVIKSIQRGLSNSAWGGDVINVTITAVDLSRAYVVVTNKAGGDVAYDELFTVNVRAKLTSATNLELRRNGTNANTYMEVQWYVIEFESGVTVQSVDLTILSTATVANATITAVDLARTILIGTWKSNGGSQYLADFGKVLLRLTTATNLRAEVLSYGFDVNITVFIVEFE